MLFSTACSLLLVSLSHVVSALPAAQSDERYHGQSYPASHLRWWQEGQSEAIYNAAGAGVKQPDPPGAAPRRQELKTDNPVPGARTIKIRSGPYTVPNMQKSAFQTGEHGMLVNYPDLQIDKPCEECTILKQWAGLEYPNGTVANIDSGMWLHHMVHFSIGPTRWDPICYNTFSLPHLAVRKLPSQAERYFTSGNERSVFDFNPLWNETSNYGTGYQLTKEDSFAYLVELMNMNMEDKLVYLTMTYDIKDGPLAPGWDQVKTFWLDANSCGTSEVPAPQQNGSFVIESKPWKPNFEGRVLSSTGHLHDGGISTSTMYDKNKLLCLEETRYSETPEFKYLGGAMGGDIVAVDHISSMSKCKVQDEGLKLSSNQQWQVVGQYDYSRHDGNIDRGSQGEVMAISIVRVVVGRNAPPKPAMLANIWNR